MLKAKNEKDINDHIRLPESFRLVWREPYRRLEAGVAFWMPNCPSGFAALGGVMTDMKKYPEFGTCYCVSAKHVERAQDFEDLYAYRGSENDLDYSSSKYRKIAFKQSSVKTLSQKNYTLSNYVLTPRLAAWPLRGHSPLSNFLEDILQPTKSKMSPLSNLGL